SRSWRQRLRRSSHSTPNELTSNFNAVSAVAGSLRLCAAPGAPAAPALVGFQRLEHHAARQELRHQAHDLVADAGNDQPFAGHEAVIAGLCDLLGAAVEQP